MTEGFAVAIPITLPRLGWAMEYGTVLAWRKQDGAPVQAGEPLFELEGDKETQEVEAADGGILRLAPNGPRPGETAPVGTLLGYLLAPGEVPPWEQAAPPETTPTISPRARRVARELGVDWKDIKGSGRTGRIRERDVRAAASFAVPRPAMTATPMRRLIAERMLAGAHTTAPVTLTTTADATNLVNLRGQFKSTPGAVVPTYTDFLVKLTAAALAEHPLLNARWAEDGIRPSEGIHIAIAVDTEAGLMAPVVRDVQALGLRQVAARSRELIELARARRLTAEQMQGGTFTVSNLGAYGVEAFTPIINLPQCAILGVGRIRRAPAVHNEQVVPRDQLTLSLTFDHRVVDGAPAARFLDTLRKYLEHPGPLLIA
jgi:pyruvate dehydrogenase E2 component (dihydrolipoamide acetyltransferase)